MPKGEKTLFLLEQLKDGVLNFSDLLIASLITSKGHQGKIPYRAAAIRHAREQWKIERAEKQRFYNLTYKLKKDGLIDCDISSQKYSLTQKGYEVVLKLRERFSRKEIYPQENDKNANIIVFDIPEKLKKQRNWLRSVLKNLGFRMLQRSVWIGKIKVPPELLEDLRKYKLLDYIEIVTITKSGTIKNIE